MFKIINNLIVCEEFFVLDRQQKDLFIKNAEHSWEIKKSNKSINAGYNTPFIGCEIECRKIYDKFLDVLKTNFFIEQDKEKSVSQPWLYLSTKYDFAEVWHNHVRTSSFHCVYYANVPEAKGGELEYEINGIFYSYKPKNYDLVIMPNYLNHRPRVCESSEPRISINMEMFSLQPVNEDLSGF
jgi:hypothetical protein